MVRPIRMRPTDVDHREPRSWPTPAFGSNSSPVFSIALHDHRQLARKGDGSSFEAEPLFQCKRPTPQRARSGRPAQHDHGGLIQQTAQLVVPTARDVAIIIDLAGLIPLGGQPHPSTDGTRVLEVRRILHSRGKRGGGHGADARHRHEQPAALVVSRHGDELLGQFSDAASEITPGLKHRHDDTRQLLLTLQDRRIETAVSFMDTSRPMYSDMTILLYDWPHHLGPLFILGRRANQPLVELATTPPVAIAPAITSCSSIGQPYWISNLVEGRKVDDLQGVVRAVPVRTESECLPDAVLI